MHTNTGTTLRRLLRTLSLIGVLSVLCACNSLYFYPMKEHVMTPQRIGVQYEDLYLKMSDGIKIHGWHLPATTARKATILFLHGNAENISTHFGSVFWLPKQGYEVYLFDYRGYGLSEGKPTIEMVVQDSIEQIQLMNSRFKVPFDELIVFGQSLGGAIAINAVAELPTQTKIRGLVFDSTFSDFRGIAREKLGDFWLTWPFQWPLSLAFTKEYSPTAAIKQIENVAILGIHGENDNIIPIKHGERLFEAATTPKQFWRITNGEHINSMVQPPIREQFVLYLDELMLGSNQLPSRNVLQLHAQSQKK